ncbi:DUF4129 domain-containing protein [Adhaeribacter pallidiroseus]|uniref:Protein-glutamine gamma-glutamyltransferase-like C-terminal domain-containing protein n=1 Tax=Adhaeribacter pallidiroseus TaxID=2072847 RepID=A0A369QKT9_9BACT|nr:DUF4129 domain-containing protein [Adhaeribacter pallidiroseus]RDC64265.1 hypothetical protein AHMF7616_02878 [Adhaeribacter pallidiroseus]
MKRIFKFLLILLVGLLSGLSPTGYAASVPPLADTAQIAADTSRVVVRPFAVDQLNTYRDNPEFQYGTDVRPLTSAWDRFWRQVREYIWSILRSRSYEGFWKYIIYGFVVVLTVYVVLKLLQVEFTGLFGKKVKAFTVPYETHAENIHELDFNTLLEEAVQQKDYRRAIRLYYLHTLKQLTDQALINWQPGKTNRSYIREIQPSKLRKDFEKITALFEYVWYGGSPVDETHYNITRQAFVTFNQLIGRHA